MKYKGQDLVQKNTTVCQFKKGDQTLEFIVSPLPMGWYQKMSTIGLSNYPPAKKIALTDSKGVVIRNKSTGKAEVTELTDDPEYKKACALITRRVYAVRLVDHLREDPNVEFDAKKPDSLKLEDWQVYADQILKELEDTSLTEEEISQILECGEESSLVLDLENVADDMLLSPTPG